MSRYRCDICKLETVESDKVPTLCHSCGQSNSPWLNLETGKVESAEKKITTLPTPPPPPSYPPPPHLPPSTSSFKDYVKIRFSIVKDFIISWWWLLLILIVGISILTKAWSLTNPKIFFFIVIGEIIISIFLAAQDHYSFSPDWTINDGFYKLLGSVVSISLLFLIISLPVSFFMNVLSSNDNNNNDYFTATFHDPPINFIPLQDLYGEYPYYCTVITRSSRLNIRMEPNVNSSIIGTVGKGEYYIYHGSNRDDTWHFIEDDDGNKGWAFSKYLKIWKMNK